MAELQAQKVCLHSRPRSLAPSSPLILAQAKYNRDVSTIVISSASVRTRMWRATPCRAPHPLLQVPVRSLQAVVSKELGAEQAKLQKQVTCAARYSKHSLQHETP
jgi:hypothetical protein